MATRNPDGTIRAANKPAILSQRMLIARWVEAEAFAQKILGVSYAKIAESMMRAVRGEIVPAVPVPAVQFPPGYRIHPRSVEKAFDRVIERQKREAVDRFRQIDNIRSEDFLLRLQPKIQKGHVEAIREGIHLLDHMAKINGYAAPKQVHLEGDLNLNGKTSSDPEESREFQVETLRAMTEVERKTIAEIMERAKVRAREIIASRNAKPALK
jgi:hypothetical protein